MHRSCKSLPVYNCSWELQSPTHVLYRLRVGSFTLLARTSGATASKNFRRSAVFLNLGTFTQQKTRVGGCDREVATAMVFSTEDPDHTLLEYS